MTKLDEKVEELQTLISKDEVKELERMTTYRLSDAIRSGGRVTSQAIGSWGDGDNACALHAAVIDAKARGYMK